MSREMKHSDVNEQDVEIFWTGGFDSTYRILELSRKDITVQPYYLVDSKYRRSLQYELDAISNIIDDIANHPETRFALKPLIKVIVSDLPPDREISEAYKRVKREIALGIQYEWLARFATTHRGIELCLEKEEGGHIFNYFNSKGTIEKITDREVSYLVFDRDKSDRDLYTIFGNYHIPLPLREMTKLDLVGEYKKHGYEKTMLKTWFCHTPVNNEPCGVCNPCKIVVKDGLSFRLSPLALKRHSTEMKYGDKYYYKLWKKVRYRIAGY
jgi:7-cyano-7-deazaguanine synthase